MAELVECARLEIVYTGNCIEGSNPPISARNKILKNSLYANFFNFIGGDRGMCASGDATQHTIRRYTIRKIIKTEFLSPRVFIDFSYCVSRGDLRHKNQIVLATIFYRDWYWIATCNASSQCRCAIFFLFNVFNPIKQSFFFMFLFVFFCFFN